MNVLLPPNSIAVCVEALAATPDPAGTKEKADDPPRGFVAGKHEVLPIPSRELQGTKLKQNPNY